MKKNVRYKRFKFLIKKNTNDNISAIAAQSAFFMILSIVPSLMFAFAVLSFFNIPREMFDTYLKSALTNEFALYFKSFIETAYDNSVGIAFTTIILALWSAGKGIYSITEGINRIYRIKSRNFWFIKRLYSMGHTLIMFLVMFIAAGILVVSGIFDELINPYVENLPYVIELVYTLRYFVAFVVIVLLMSLALKFYLRHKVKDKRLAKLKLQLPGVALTALCWILFSLGIGIYVEYFNGFSLYGSLATLAVIMIWIYFSMYIMLFCIQLNYVYRRRIYKFSLKHIDKNV